MTLSACSIGTSLARGAHEMLGAVALRDTWIYSGLQDIRLRYRRSFLGPWWLTLSTAITIAVLGLLWSQIFGMEIADYLPYFAIGHVVWTWISAQLNDACAGFTQFEHIIKQTRLPYPTYLLRLSMRHTLILAHNAIVIAVVLLLCGIGLHALSWLAVIGVGAVFAICVLLAVPIAICCTRFRDLPPLVASGLQVLFFLTPILWQPGALRSAAWMAELNPLFHWIALIREPLLGRVPSATHYAWTVASLAVLGTLAVWLLGRQRDRIAYWM
ncbi:MAG TPA: ABC transporter permease [Nitrospira sp.]|nr:ABC transporter permease [Nitrospira sp.]